MSLSNARALFASTLFLAISACNAAGTVPSNAARSAVDRDARPGDSASILKKLKKDVVIGSTVDPSNGDTGPHGISIANFSYGLKKGQLVICNFADSSGAAGKGTTLEVLNPKPNSKPATFAQSGKVAGCAGDVVSNGNSVYAMGATSHLLVAFDDTGKLKKTYGAPYKQPFSDVDASCPPSSTFCGYSAEYIFGSDVTTGSIISFSINGYGRKGVLQVATGFAVNKKSGWSTLGPSGLQYNPAKDELYIADGVDNTVVAFTNASVLLVKNEIIVQPGGKTFKCKYISSTCGRLVYSGNPLDAPVAMAILPNGNLIVANTQGGNKLVELTPSGKLLATKVVDSSKTAGIFGLEATGTNDATTALFYTDANDNKLHELEQ